MIASHLGPLSHTRWRQDLETGSAKKLQTALADARLVLDNPQWDALTFCRFLSSRVPQDGEITATALADLAEGLIADLERGQDRQTEKAFPTPLLNDRGALINDFLRHCLLEVGEVCFNADFATAMRPRLKFAAAGGAEPEPAAATEA